MTTAGHRLRVLFALPHLARGGGAERVMLTLLQRIDREAFDPQLLVLDASRNELADEVPADVALVDLAVSRVRYAVNPMLRALRQVRPAVLVSGLGHLNLMIAMMRPLLPRSLAVVGRETAVVSAFNAEFRTARLRDFAYRRFYPNLDLVVCQSEDMRDDLVGRLGFPEDRTRLIPNPVDVERIRSLAAAPGLPAAGDFTDVAGGLRLVAIGRLAPQKGFDLLLDAIAILPRGSCELAIVGEGPLHGRLASRIAELGLHDQVRLAGFMPNPHALVKRADALVLSSRYEGLPNVVLEALANGTPVIATPCTGGLAEIARRAGGVTLAKAVSAQSLAAAIGLFRGNRRDATPIDLGPYRAESVVRQYESLIRLAAQRAARR